MSKRVHFLGIGGSGASAAAAIAEAQGFEVTGCDLNPHTEFTTIFQPAQLQTDHSPKHLYCHPEERLVTKDLKTKESRDSSLKTPQNDKPVDILAVTPAIFSLDPNNEELQEAKKQGIEILTWQQFVGKYLAKEKQVIAVCGTHGKTTTTAMIAQILEDARLDPTVELGGIIPRWKTNFRIGKGKYFVVEADEFNDNFLSHFPQITVVTNIEMDHPEYFNDFKSVKASFEKFLLQTKSTIVANLSNLAVAEVLKDVMKQSKVSCFDYSKSELNLKLKIPGEFNQLNAAAAFKVGLLLNIDPSVIKQSLENYIGVGRRFEYLGEFNKAKIYSDFAHHPTEIKTTMEAARQKFPKERIILVYQPHMFSRTKALFEDFVSVFRELPVDKSFIVDIYPSREIDIGLVSSKELVEVIDKPSVSYLGNVEKVLTEIKAEIKKDDIVFFMGAGSIDQAARKLVKQKVLVFGLGLNQGGVGVAKFFAQNGAEVRVTDLKSKEVLQPSLDQLKEFRNISYTLGGHKFEDIDWADLIIKNPAIKPGNKYIEYALEKNKQSLKFSPCSNYKAVETDFSIFLQFANQKKIIAITGTKGKTTTASLIFEALKANNQEVVLAGNIGKSILDTLTHLDKDPWIIVEISSFQLQALKGKNFAPKIAVITNIYPDHLNWHSSMEEYIQAKKIIALGQTSDDFLVLPSQEILHSREFQQDIKSQIVEFCAEDFKEDFPDIDLPLKGLANLENYATALTVTGILKIDDQKALQAFQYFKGARFRMQEIGVFNGVKIINDSTSTNPISTIEALKTLEPGVILIAGGMNKGMQYHKLAAQIENYTPVKALYLLSGDATDSLLLSLRAKRSNLPIQGPSTNLKELLKDVKKIAKSGDIILFSPAATSFNLFQNEFDRGEKFNTAVKKIFR